MFTSCEYCSGQPLGMHIKVILSPEIRSSVSLLPPPKRRTPTSATTAALSYSVLATEPGQASKFLQIQKGVCTFYHWITSQSGLTADICGQYSCSGVSCETSLRLFGRLPTTPEVLDNSDCLSKDDDTSTQGRHSAHMATTSSLACTSPVILDEGSRGCSWEGYWHGTHDGSLRTSQPTTFG